MTSIGISSLIWKLNAYKDRPILLVNMMYRCIRVCNNKAIEGNEHD